MRIFHLIAVTALLTSSAGPGFAGILLAATETQGKQENTPDSSPSPAQTQEPTETPLPGLSVTPTSPPDPRVTPSSTVTFTETITPTTQPILTPVPREGTQPPAPEPNTELITITIPVTLTLSSPVSDLTPGSQAALIYEIDNFELLPKDSNLQLAITAPSGFELKTWPGGVYKAGAATVIFTPAEAIGELLWIAGDASYGPYNFSAILTYADQSLSADEITLGEKNVFPIVKDGGTAAGEVGGITVTVNIPAGALPEAIDLRIQPVGEKTPPHKHLETPSVRLTAIGQISGLPIDQFAADLAITLEYDPEILYGPASALMVHYYDYETSKWIPVKSEIDLENHSVTGWMDHFTPVGAGIVDWETARTPTMEGFQVAQFTGAATYGTSFWVPAGPGGLQPSLSLSYNSQVVDGATFQTQASYVGMGWSLDTGYIQRNQHGTGDDLSDDTFSVVVNGTSGMLMRVTDPAGTPSDVDVYRMANDNFWRFWAYKDANGVIIKWSAWDKAGNKYTFGDQTLQGSSIDSTPDDRAWYPNCSGSGPDEWVWQWPLVRMETAHTLKNGGQGLNYFYITDDQTNFKCYEGDSNHTFTRAVYPKFILYPNSQYLIQFDLSSESRADYDEEEWTDEYARIFYQRRQLNSITIRIWDAAQPVVEQWRGPTIHKYNFVYSYQTNPVTEPIYPDYTWSGGGQTLTLVQLIESGLNGNLPLPPLTFSYDRMHLIEATNGYGGEVDFDYDRWSTPNDSNPDMAVGYPGSCSGSVNGWLELGAGDDVSCDGGQLHIDGAIYRSIPLNQLSPGWDYRFVAIDIEGDSGTAKLRFGIDYDGDGVVDVYSPFQTFQGSGQQETLFDRLQLNQAAFNDGDEVTDNDARFVVECEGGCTVHGHIRLSRVLTRYRVVKRTLTDTSTGTPLSYEYDYTYFGPAVNGPLGEWKVDENYNQPRGVFLGHASVKVIGPDGLMTKIFFHQDDVLKGRTDKVEVWNLIPDPNQLVSRTSYSYAYYRYDHAGCMTEIGSCGADVNSYSHTIVLPTNPDNNDAEFEDLGLAWIYTKDVVSEVCDSGVDCIKTRVRYEYNDEDQKKGGTTNSQYGNVTSVFREEWISSSWTAISEIWTRFFPNDNASGDEYFVGLQGFTNIHECSGGSCAHDNSSLRRSVWYLYDGSIDFDDVPTDGILTGQRTLVCFWDDGPGHGQPGFCVDPSAGYDVMRYSDQQYSYDTWGNQTSVKVYRNFGEFDDVTWTSTPAWDPSLSPIEQEMTTQYDSTYHTFPETITNELGHSTTITYERNYGLPLTIEGPNGPDTKIEMDYDDLGRLIWVVQPGDAPGSPTVSFDYWKDTDPLPFFTEATAKVDESTTFSYQKYYDGLGRLIQTQALGVKVTDGACDDGINDPDICNILAYFDFDAAGRAEQTSVPVALIGTSSGFDTSPDFTNKTSYQYDALGRIATVTGTDSSTTTYGYGYDAPSGRFFSTVTDAENNQTKSYTDDWGRVAEVEPAAGPGLSYTYDVLGQLIAVDKGNSPTTTIDYDLAGRKVSMDDPDMGAWSYDYDALGNLAWQKDAKGQVTCFYYDGLSRLIGKHYRSDTNCPSSPTYDIEYLYDDYAGFAHPTFWDDYAKGQRTGMIDGSGHTLWAYDERGRLVTELKTIDTRVYDTHWTYGSANQIITMTYPKTDEVVNFDYHPQLAVDRVSGNSTYVDSTQYDAAGRIDMRVLAGGNIETDYGYFDWDVNGAGRLETIVTQKVPHPASPNLQNLAYTYDAVGNVLTITDNLVSGGPQVQTFTYDDLNRLETAIASGGTDGTFPLETYSYDAEGRYTGYMTTGDDMSITYNTTGHYHAADSATIGALVNDYTYDANGNMITRDIDGDGLYDLVYDEENRLVDVDKDSVDHMTFVYDGDGNRVMAVDDVTGYVTYYVGNYFEETIEATPSYPYCSAPGVAIPDNNGTGVSDTITISGTSGTLTDLNVYLEIDHPRVGELLATLEHDDTSTVVELIERPKYPPTMCSGDDIDTLFDDAAGTAAESGCQEDTDPTPGLNDASYQPNGLLSDFDTESLNGNWTLTVKDRGSGNTGTLVSWCLDPSGPTASLENGDSVAAERNGKVLVLASALPQNQFNNIVFSLAHWIANMVIGWVNVRQAASHSIEEILEIPQMSGSPGTGEVWKSYYYAGGQRVAVRVQEGVSDDTFYIMNDHLGSTTVTANASGDYYSELRFKPWGEIRYDSASGGNETPTDFGFTGQRRNDEIGLLFYQTRYYDTYPYQFTQPDNIIQDPFNPKSFNRYAYAFYNPTTFVDPSGNISCHFKHAVEGDCDPEAPPPTYTPPSPPPENPPLGLGDDGIAGFEGISILAGVTDAWWGATLSAQEAIAIYLFQEFGPNISDSDVLEAVTRKYWQFCSEGAWSTDCFQGFWGYAEAIRRADDLLSKYRLYDLRTFQDGFYWTYAGRVLNPKNKSWMEGQRADRPSEWVTLTSYRNPQTLPDIAANAGDLAFYYSTYSDAESNEYLFLVLSADQQAAIAAKYKLSSDNLTSLP